MQTLKEIALADQNILFKQADAHGLWVAYIENNNKTFSIELCVSDSSFDWEDVQKFLVYITRHGIPNEAMLEKSKPLLLSLAKIFWESEESCFEFLFSGINFKKVGTSLSNTAFSYELVFDLKSLELDDSYSNWIIEMSDKRILGVRREQL